MKENQTKTDNLTEVPRSLWNFPPAPFWVFMFSASVLVTLCKHTEVSTPILNNLSEPGCQEVRIPTTTLKNCLQSYNCVTTLVPKEFPAFAPIWKTFLCLSLIVLPRIISPSTKSLKADCCLKNDFSLTRSEAVGSHTELCKASEVNDDTVGREMGNQIHVAFQRAFFAFASSLCSLFQKSPREVKMWSHYSSVVSPIFTQYWFTPHFIFCGTQDSNYQ